MDHRFRLLIIDDDSGDKLLMQRAIKQSWLEAVIEFAHSGEEGIAKAAAFSPHVIILDSSMPGMDGFEVCRQIKAKPNNPKIIICTGAVDNTVINKAKAAGADGCCLKTVDYKPLVEQLQDLFLHDQ